MSDKYSILYSPEAKDDLKSIYSYIAFDLVVEIHKTLLEHNEKAWNLTH